MFAQRFCIPHARLLNKRANRDFLSRFFSSAAPARNFKIEGRYKEILTPELLKSKAKQFDEDGYTVIDEFYDSETIDEVRNEMDKIISEAESAQFNNKAIFTTSKQIEHLSQSTDYFLDSASKISFFYEKDAFNKEGKLNGPLNSCLNKVGHAMHDLNPVFHKFCYSNAIKTVCSHVLQYSDPMLVQTMYIFKSPKVGGEVTPHQDTDNSSTYIVSKPLTCKAIWVALDDATVKNGCLWGIPGSHKTTPITYASLQKK